MRTVLFRGYIKYPSDIINGFWYGDLIHYANGDIYIRQVETGMEQEVIPESVGQFTGVVDKNGVGIYEGDILKVDIFSKPYLISFGQSEKWGACFCVQSHNSITFLTKNWSSTSEVIGNIHENPEMIHGVPELL